MYKLKAFKFQHTPCNNVNEHIFSSILFIYLLLASVEVFSKFNKREQKLMKTSKVMSEV